MNIRNDLEELNSSWCFWLCMVLWPTCEALCRHSLPSFSRHYVSIKLSLMLDWQRVILMLALPLISLAVFLVVLVCIILCLLCRPSAKRTVTLRAIHLQQNISSAESSFFATIIFLLHSSGIAQHSTDSTLGEGVLPKLFASNVSIFFSEGKEEKILWNWIYRNCKSYLHVDGSTKGGDRP